MIFKWCEHATLGMVEPRVYKHDGSWCIVATSDRKRHVLEKSEVKIRRGLRPPQGSFIVVGRDKEGCYMILPKQEAP